MVESHAVSGFPERFFNPSTTTVCGLAAATALTTAS